MILGSRPATRSGTAWHKNNLVASDWLNRSPTQPEKNHPPVSGTDLRGNGALRPSINKHFQPIEFLKIPSLEKPDFSREIIENYQKGLSLSEIAKLVGRSRSTVLATLKRNSVNLRPKHGVSTREYLRHKRRSHNRPYYGFCYMDGRLMIHPSEFPTLRLIHRKWQEKRSIHQIACELNRKKIKSREGRQWGWATIRKIVNRFEQKSIIIHHGGEYELR